MKLKRRGGGVLLRPEEKGNVWYISLLLLAASRITMYVRCIFLCYPSSHTATHPRLTSLNKPSRIPSLEMELRGVLSNTPKEMFGVFGVLPLTMNPALPPG
jgi:hypothetical protein